LDVFESKSTGVNLLEAGFPVGSPVVKRLLQSQQMGHRKIAKVQTMKGVAGRNTQFENISQLQQQYLTKGDAVLSMDVKKKE
jgi:hypothetical protein